MVDVTRTFPRVSVLGVPVAAVSFRTAVELISSWVGTETSRYITLTSVHGVMESRRSEELAEAHRSAAMCLPDGMPLVWACRRAGETQTDRVCGPDIVPVLCARAAREGWSIFLYGGRPDTLARLRTRLVETYPGLVIAGAYSPPFRALSPSEEAAAISAINASGADVVLVGLSTPKQERWMARSVARLTSKVLLGVGAVFDIEAGDIGRAPDWMHHRGLEWVYRLRKEPSRLAGRYMRNNPLFMLQIARNGPSRVEDV